ERGPKRATRPSSSAAWAGRWQIKPDHKALPYYLKLERWEYVFHRLHLFKHYYVNGMKWQSDGSLTNPPFDFVNEED
ncbi:hypothetical protein LI169_21155, partial [Desulfovibrio desulfuricans]|nr:hypothetical protein [Desulfovibrio desulfuricans]